MQSKRGKRGSVADGDYSGLNRMHAPRAGPSVGSLTKKFLRLVGRDNLELSVILKWSTK